MQGISNSLCNDFSDGESPILDAKLASDSVRLPRLLRHLRCAGRFARQPKRRLLQKASEDIRIHIIRLTTLDWARAVLTIEGRKSDSAVMHSLQIAKSRGKSPRETACAVPSGNRPLEVNAFPSALELPKEYLRLGIE